MVGSKSWVILSDVERSIKEKIEKVGKPLKEWNIQIYRGVLTGCNEAFIISTDKRNEILSKCIDEAERDRTEKLIRPILRGRDIKRYSYHWSGLWLIATFPSRHYDIEMYPAVKDYLLSNFGMERLEQTGNEYIIKGEKVKARKKTNNKWFETQDSISYWEDFDKPKIIYPDIMRLPKSISKIDTYPNIAFDNDGYVPEATLFMMNGESIENICSYLTSDIGFFIFARFYMGPILRGRDIKRYGYKWSGLWLINTHNGVKGKIERIRIEDYPSVKAYLDQFWDKISTRSDKGDTPYNLRNCAYMEDFDKPKIIWGNLNLKPSYALAEGAFYVNAPSPMIVPASKYLLAILNSKVGDYYIRNLGVTRNGGYFEYKPMFVEQLPVPIISEDEQEALEIILSESTQETIDSIIYSLYALSEQEIEFIENQ